MSKLLTTAFCIGIFSLGFVSPASAALETKLSNQDYYSNDLDTIWAMNANMNDSRRLFDQVLYGVRLEEVTKNFALNAWPVHQGDVTKAVPEPSMVILLGLGLAVLIGFNLHQRQQ